MRLFVCSPTLDYAKKDQYGKSRIEDNLAILLIIWSDLESNIFHILFGKIFGQLCEEARFVQQIGQFFIIVRAEVFPLVVRGGLD